MTEIIENATTKIGMANEETHDMLMTAGGYIAAAVALFLIGFFGFFLNLWVIILMWKEKQVGS